MSDVTDAIDAINAGTAVYVAPGCTGPSQTAVAALTGKDQIVLIVLPAGAGDPASVVRQIDAATGSKKVIGLIVGDKPVGYASRFQPGVASDLMSRASSISNTPQQALVVFVNKVHEYQQTAAGQDAMRDTVTATSTPPPSPTGPNTPLAVGAILSVVVVLAVAIAAARRWAQHRAAAREQSSNWADRAVSADALVEWGEVTPPLDASDLPANATRSFKRIRGWLSDIAPHWDEISDTDIGAGVKELMFSTVPTTLRLWNALPEDLRTKSRNGSTPAQRIDQQFAAIEAAVSQVRDAAFDGTIDQLTVESVFVQKKYGRQTNLLGLDT